MKKVRKQRPTLKTIAELSGFAVPTVSRALSDAPDISENTKIRVRQIAAEIGYSPNRAGLRLRTGKTQVIAVVLLTSHDVINQTAMLIESIAAQLRDSAYHMIVLPYMPDEDPMATVRYVVETGAADALILNGILPDDPRIRYLNDISFPFACHGRCSDPGGYPWFDFDHTAFAALAMYHFEQRNRRNIAVIAPPLDQSYGIALLDGVKQNAGTKMSIKVVEGIDSNSMIEPARDALEQHWSRHPETDAFLCVSSSSALALLGLCKEKGRTIGEDLDIVTREFMPMFASLDEQIICVLEDVREAGRFLGRAILQRLENPDEQPLQMLDAPSIPDSAIVVNAS